MDRIEKDIVITNYIDNSVEREEPVSYFTHDSADSFRYDIKNVSDSNTEYSAEVVEGEYVSVSDSRSGITYTALTKWDEKLFNESDISAESIQTETASKYSEPSVKPETGSTYTEDEETYTESKEQTQECYSEEFSFEDYDDMYESIEDESQRIVQFKAEPHENTSLNFKISVISDTLFSTELNAEDQRYAKDFLECLIDNVVAQLSLNRNVQTVRERLDKVELFKEIKRVVQSLREESKVHSFVEKRAVFSCRRKGKTNFFGTDSSEEYSKVRFTEVSLKLDQLLGQETAQKKITTKNIEDLEKELEGFKGKYKLLRHNFKILVEGAFKCDTRKKFALTVHSELQKMALLRKEISEARTIIIDKEHIIGTILKQQRDLEIICGNYRYTDYTVLQSNNTKLETKIKDRQEEFEKVLQTFKRNLHLKTHINLKCEGIELYIIFQNNYLSDLQKEVLKGQERLYHVQLKHNRLRNEIKELQWQTGLRDKPILLNDFDKTMVLLKKKHGEVEELRKKYAEMKEKLQKAEKRMSSTKENPVSSKSLMSNPKKPNLKDLLKIEAIEL